MASSVQLCHMTAKRWANVFAGGACGRTSHASRGGQTVCQPTLGWHSAVNGTPGLFHAIPLGRTVRVEFFYNGFQLFFSLFFIIIYIYVLVLIFIICVCISLYFLSFSFSLFSERWVSIEYCPWYPNSNIRFIQILFWPETSALVQG